VLLVEGAVVVVVVVALAGLLRAGAVGGIDGLWATAKEAVAARTIAELSKVMGLMMVGIVWR
jgi:septation ring formation regulator EzrA